MKLLCRLAVCVLALLLVILVTAAASAEEISYDKALLEGGILPAADAAKLEAALKANPNDFNTRSMLLGYYFTRRFNSDDIQAKRARSILWIIERRPESEIAGSPLASLDQVLDKGDYAKGKALWLKQTKARAKDARVIGNAADFFLLAEPSQAEELFLKGEKLEPKNPKWPKELAHAYSLRYNYATGEEKRELAAKALAKLHRSYELTKSDEKHFLLPDLAQTAFDAGDMAASESYAKATLREADAFDGHIILGRIALAKGDHKKAGECLLDAGRSPGSPTRMSFGPNMALAKELLDAGEKEVVLQYLELCGKFWKSGKERLSEWRATIKDGKTPDFGANLFY